MQLTMGILLRDHKAVQNIEGEVNKYLGLKSQDSFDFLEDRLRAPANDSR